MPFRRKKSEETSQLYSMLALAQAGDETARNDLIESYTPFILRTASQASRRYIDRGQDDEFSIALMAMNEAIDRFDGSKKSSFLGFAETIIRRRLIDYYRSQKSQNRSVPWTEFDVSDDEDNVINYVEVKTSIDAYEMAEEQEARRSDIEAYAQALRHYGLTFSDLVELSPKHADARQSAIQVAKIVASDEAMRAYVHERKALPLKLLEDKVNVSRKTLERQRKYILAVVILLSGEFQHLQAYIS
ncbi:RNA polymerase sigma factor [Alicyclobacillus cycloheptanicus]|uniref:RNA polymerase sigma factor SigI n=1 Tax=Alicyclobacillus cycloheptanicus TaxID=1457 RepID=A0ABT9XEL7_9BACL|nr:RNA polymerase sigma factor [Alicyclobacillus cycloheptanicus]